MKRIFVTGAGSTSARALLKRLAPNTEIGVAVRSRERFLEQIGLNPQLCRQGALAWSLENEDFPCGLSLFECDATSGAAVQEAVSTFASGGNAQAQLDGYAHFPGSVLLKPAHSTRDEEWEEVLRVNLTSAFLGLKAALGPMRKSGSGSIVFLSSVAATRGLPSHEAISAAKAGLEAMARSAAASYPGIRVNCVAPGLTEAKMTEKILSSEAATRASLSLNAIRRPGRGEDVAEAVYYLLSDLSGYVTGQVLHVDGGMSTLGFPKA